MTKKAPSTNLVTKEAEHLKKTVEKQRQAVFERFPLLFTLLGSFGLVATFYGFEGIIDRIPLLKENPVILLLTGIISLSITGTLYKKLQ